MRLEDCFQAAGFQCKNYPLRTPPLTPNSLLQLALMKSSAQTAIDELLRLESSYRPGLSIQRLFQILTICRCGIIMTRHAFTRHFCRYIVVDLTTQSDSEDDIGTVPLVLDLDELV